MIELAPGAILYGLTNAASYLLIALGVTLLFGSMRVFFFTHGSLYMMSAMLLTYFGVTMGLNLVVSILAAFIILIAFSLFISMVIYPRVSHSAEAGFIAFLALALILESVAVLAFGVLPKNAPTLAAGAITIFNVPMSLERALLVPVCALFVGLLFLFLYRTKIGKALRAIVQNAEMSYVLGINPTRVNMVVFMVAFGLVAVAGLVVAPTVYVEPAMGNDPLLKAFIIIIMGGLGNIPGAILASVIVGILESLVGTYIGPAAAMTAIFILILITLIWRPRGIFGRGQL